MTSQERNEVCRRSDQQEPRRPYYQAARFASEPPALTAYMQAQELILRARGRCDLSAYRFLLERVPHVAVLGERPTEDIDWGLRAILAAGVPTMLPDQILARLLARRLDASRYGPWVEGHYRPGRRL